MLIFYNEVYKCTDLPLAFVLDFQPSFGLAFLDLTVVAVTATGQPYFQLFRIPSRIQRVIPPEERTRAVWSLASVEPLSTRRRLGGQN